SVTYYESNRPRQYYPDFIIAARDKDGREVMWLAETKGEIRPNTALKSEAALAAGVKTLAELSESLVRPRDESQFRLISLEDERVKREAFKTLLPIYT